MSKLAGVVQLLEKEEERLTRELRRITAALAACGQTYAKNTRPANSPRQLGPRLPREHAGPNLGEP
jgi:hypothetical protein